MPKKARNPEPQPDSPLDLPCWYRVVEADLEFFKSLLCESLDVIDKRRKMPGDVDALLECRRILVLGIQASNRRPNEERIRQAGHGKQVIDHLLSDIRLLEEQLLNEYERLLRWRPSKKGLRLFTGMTTYYFEACVSLGHRTREEIKETSDRLREENKERIRREPRPEPPKPEPRTTTRLTVKQKEDLAFDYYMVCGDVETVRNLFDAGLNSVIKRMDESGDQVRVFQCRALLFQALQFSEAQPSIPLPKHRVFDEAIENITVLQDILLGEFDRRINHESQSPEGLETIRRMVQLYSNAAFKFGHHSHEEFTKTIAGMRKHRSYEYDPDLWEEF